MLELTNKSWVHNVYDGEYGVECCSNVTLLSAINPYHCMEAGQIDGEEYGVECSSVNPLTLDTQQP